VTPSVRDALGRWIGSDKATRKERDEWGVIVTAREQESGELWSLHEPGLRMEALRAVAERLDHRDGDWRVICYSTPASILGDMTAKRQVQHAGTRQVAHLDCMEAQALGKIGRIDLLDPVLRK
jgi:hypothetical protein